ncbi:ras GTPase-activating-like protein IQGAP1 isoform X3 [Belonocnema kinseyi]|uniref:ras GTPase-activating-like protein IQGAP1 isoform X3 n=1 Tax=Belonocnema kinseyi TaxID=2817044 RepID=UPI00143D8715|nr:ras GTPase-activating-like protein IQGAP1 isoform X3 [Belonocnema kinseyi]
MELVSDNSCCTEDKYARRTAAEMDDQRQKTLAYEYLCHLEEAKKWLEVCLRENLPTTTKLEENLRNGVYLAKLGHFMAPDILSLNKIYDIEQKRYTMAGLEFRHTDNINHFMRCLKSMHLPMTFQPETTDIYDKKNMPRVIYCIHALSTHLFKLGKAPQIQDLYGKVSFTDEEIDAVSMELKEYNIQMPPFQKIGGLLATNMEGDTAASHAAIIAINQSLSVQDENATLIKLKNIAACFKNIKNENIKYYYNTLVEAKEMKAQAALNRSLNDSYGPDAYDELLTQTEIQGHINSINVQRALCAVVESIFGENKHLISALSDPVLQVQKVSYENCQIYKEKIAKLIQKRDWQENFHYQQKLLQKTVDNANNIALNISKKETVYCLNKALLEENLQEFSKTLMDPNLGLNDNIDEFSIPLYYEEMKIDCTESKKNVSYTDIVVSIRVLSTIAAITKAVDIGNLELTYQALCCPEAHIMDLEEENKVKYFMALTAVRCEKRMSGEGCPLLTYNDIQESIDLVNKKCLHDDEVIQVLRNLNSAVTENKRGEVMEALQATSLKLNKPVSLADTSLYLKLFKKCLFEKHSDGSELWLEDIHEVTEKVANEAQDVQSACTLLAQINKGLQKNNFIFTMNWLKTAGLQIMEKNRAEYFEALCTLYKTKKENYACPYVIYITPAGNESHLDLEKFCYTWDYPKKITESRYITFDDIRSILKKVTNELLQSQPDKRIIHLVLKFQAHIRGYLFRKRISDRFAHYYDNIKKVKQIQIWWRSVLIRKYYTKLLKERGKQRAQESYQFLRVKGKYESVLEWYKEQENKVIKIQALWRGKAARKAFHSLLRLDKPPLSVVKRFSAILNFNNEDYDKDLQLQQLKNEVVLLIRHNQNLSHLLDNMDIKIGLLIQNRITLQDVVAHGKNLEFLTKTKNTSRLYKDSSSYITTHKGLKSLTKEGRRMLEGYQHLFYALQTNPIYVSKLLFLLPQSKSNKFLQNVILTLFNFGTNIREEYLLLKLLGTALQEEIRCKFDKPCEVVTGNPLVLKMAVNYARQLNGQRALRQILGPSIQKILSDKTINIETNPVDIYKCWRNQLEMDTGETLDLPYTLTHEQALQYDQVRQRLNNGIKVLKSTVKELLTGIIASRKLIPYGMLYMAKVLNETLTAKFPNSPEKDMLKVVGNFIYYHFINAAIVAPDAFDIISLPIDRSLSNDQRRNLASIAKILQFASSKKGFGDEATHLVCLNPFIIECHEKFKNFFRYCCQIEELEEHFSIHEYTEATLIQKPEICISLQEICDTHQLVLEYQDQIASDPLDPLHELLEDLGTAPTVASLLGLGNSASETNMSRYGKTEVCLTLTNKFEVPENEETNLNKLFIKTKELLVSVLRFLKGNNLVEALEATSSPIQEKLYDIQYSSSIPALNVVHNSLSLNDCKLQLLSYLKKLELGGWVSQKDGYQNIVTAVAKDVCNKGRYRFIRNKDLQMLRVTKQRLEEKSNYYKEQVKYYSQYIQRCLENLHTGKGSLHAIKIGQKRNHGKLKSRMTLKYSGAKLQEKGVLLEIEGLPQAQFKNVTFEITPTERNGIFTVRGKFMGVEMETIDMDIQKLLELQFEGAPIIDMFGKAKINVNLLLFLLNRKFYVNTKT